MWAKSNRPTQWTQATAQGQAAPVKYDLGARPSLGAFNITFGANICIST